MKEFKKLTNEEVYNLTHEEIENYKKLALAENGIKFPVKPVAPAPHNIEPDTTIYVIDGVSDRWNGVCFKKFEDAENFAKMIKDFTGICHITRGASLDITDQHLEEGLPLNWNGSKPTLDIRTEKVFSKELYETTHEAIKEYNKQLSEYNIKMKQYDELMVEVYKTCDFIGERIESVRDDFYRKNNLTRLFIDYLPISDGNEEIAMKFFCKAYEVSEEDKAYILANKDKYIKQ